MQIDKQQIIDLLKEQGQHTTAAQAATDMADQVDTTQHAALLSKLGVNPQDLIGEPAGLLD